jgi:hypothetical protein
MLRRFQDGVVLLVFSKVYSAALLLLKLRPKSVPAPPLPKGV